MLRWQGRFPSQAPAYLLPNSRLPIVASQDWLRFIDCSSRCVSIDKHGLISPKAPLELILHCLPGVNNMSKEHRNKRDAKKKPVMSPKEKKTAKLAKKKVSRNILEN
jgi:hypothetical protein